MYPLILAAATFLGEPTLAGAHVGYYAVDVASGATVENVRSGDGFVPASTMKLLVASTALDLLPPGFAYVTTLESAGRRNGATLDGDVTLRGGGDASLDDAALDDAAATLQRDGITAVNGSLIADSSRYTGAWYPPGWAFDDLVDDYGAPVTALAFEDNAVTVAVAPGPAGMPAILRPDALPGVRLSNATISTPGDDTVDASRDPLCATCIRIVGSIPPNAPADEVGLALPDPPSFALARLRAALAARGIAVTGGDRVASVEPAAVLWARRFGNLEAVLQRFLPPSNNLMAEQLLNELGARSDGAGATDARGIAAERRWLHDAGIDGSTSTIADGSGLSSYDRLTPRMLVNVLLHEYRGSHRAALLAALPRAGDRGTLAHSFAGTPLAHVLVAKTGSMNHVRTLAGYVITAQKVTAFALLIDDWMDEAPGASARLERARTLALEALL